MSIEAGQQVSHYRLIEEIGAGGMGVVWKAEDTVLKRTVAIKFLPPEVVRDEERRRMFLEEARLASSVSDAHIAQVYEFSHDEGLDFIVMEFVEGKSLDKILHGRPLPPHKVVDYGHQVARALSRAHRKQLLHRDLKPGNILVTEEGDAKVVDFGLATLFQRQTSFIGSAESTRSVIEEDRRGGDGRIAGTLPYMSPEQVQGEKLDARSDIFSLGSVLYEMTTGHQPFVGATGAEVAREIVKSHPRPVHEQVPSVPIELARIIDKALAPRRGDRYQATEDLAVDLRLLGRELETGSAPSYGSISTPVASVQNRSLLWVGLTIVFVVALSIVVSQLWLRQDAATTPERPAGTQAVPVHRQLTYVGTAGWPAISPDGTLLAYVERTHGAPDAGERAYRLLVQDVSGGKALQLLTTKAISDVRWSPPGTHLLVASGAEHAQLVPRLGGTPRKLPPAFFVAWSPDGLRYAAVAPISKEIAIYNIETGEEIRSPISVPYVWIRGLDWAPDGRHLSLLTVDSQNVYSVWLIPIGVGEPRRLISTPQQILSPRFAGTHGELYFLLISGSTFNLSRIDAAGPDMAPPEVLMTGLDVSRYANEGINVSRNASRLVYARNFSRSNLWVVESPHQNGRMQIGSRNLTAGTSRDSNPSVSPDGSMIAFERDGDIWIAEMDSGATSQLTFSEAREDFPAWSPDGSLIAFGSDAGGYPKVWTIPSAGGTPQSFRESKLSSRLGGIWWSPADRIIYRRMGNQALVFLDVVNGQEEIAITDLEGGYCGAFRYSEATGQMAVSVGRYKEDAAERFIAVAGSRPNGFNIVYRGPAEVTSWSMDGESLYAWDESGRRAIRLKVESGAEEVLFEWPFGDSNGGCWESTPDGLWLCEVAEFVSDVWLVDNFDPDVN